MINKFKNTILHGDCLDLMQDIPNGSIDLVVTDPPYGIDFNSNFRAKSKLKSVKGILNDGNDNIEFLRDSANEIYRVLKDNSRMYWFTRWDKVDEQKPMLEEIGFNVKNNIIWMKNNWSMGDLKGAYAGQYECILFCHKGRRELNEVDDKKRHADILNFDRVANSKLKHSHEKPLELIEFLIKKSSDKNDIVLDPFLGSGTTAEACINTGRNYVGFELDKDYINVANERLSKSIDKKLYAVS